jgi:D-alanyl-D-alanine carboxypeptidase/D-alanyl-D-alanine-endopeptidase (penicillin-binding protein 4)
MSADSFIFALLQKSVKDMIKSINSIKAVFLSIAFSVSICDGWAQVPAAQGSAEKTATQKYVELVAQNDVLKNSLFGVCAKTDGGKTLVNLNGGKRMLPASNMKLISTGAALHRLGPDFRFETRIGCSGTVKDGVLHGDIYIVGGGDPTIASKDSIAIPRFMLMGKWKAFLDAAGIKKVDGRIIGDGRYFDGPLEKDTWSYQDIGTAYGTGMTGLSYYENAQDFDVSAGAKVGDPVSVKVRFPSTPWMKYSYTCKTGKAGTGDELYFYTSEYIPYGEVRGTFAIDRKPKTEEFSNKFGAYTCAFYFKNYLTTHGIEVTGNPADIFNGRVREDLSKQNAGDYAAKVDDLKILGSTYSPELSKIIKKANHASDNFYAETCLRMLGRRFHHSACYDSSYVALDEVLAKLGASPDGVQIADGSGLSRHNYVTPEYFVKFLSAMMESPYFGEYAASLPQPGKGTLSSRLRGESNELKSRIFMKSGSMNGVLCYSGYIVPEEGSKDDAIVFSIMTNNVLARTSEVGRIVDRILVLLAEE